MKAQVKQARMEKRRFNFIIALLFFIIGQLGTIAFILGMIYLK